MSMEIQICHQMFCHQYAMHLTESISFNFESFFSMTFVVCSRFDSYKLVPDASSIIDNI